MAATPPVAPDPTTMASGGEKGWGLIAKNPDRGLPGF
jgi:hypothetical protein